MSRIIRYGRTPCKCCGKEISTNGLAYNSHMMAHVRRGEAKRTLQLDIYVYYPITRK